MASLGRHQLWTSISFATGIVEPRNLFQWILHWNLHLNPKKLFSGVHFWAAREIFPESVGRAGVERGDTIPVLTSSCQCADFWSTKDTLLHAGMPTHTLIVSAIGCGSGEVASIIAIWAVDHTTLVSLQIGAFDLSRWRIGQKVHDQLDLWHDGAVILYMAVLAVTRLSLGW